MSALDYFYSEHEQAIAKMIRLENEQHAARSKLEEFVLPKSGIHAERNQQNFRIQKTEQIK